MRMVLNSYTMVCLPVWELIHSLKLVDYVLLRGDKPWYNYYLTVIYKEGFSIVLAK